MSMICQSPTNHPLPPSYFADAAIECAQLRLASAEKWVAASMQLLSNARYQLSSSQHELNDARECLTRLLEDAAAMQYLPMEEQQEQQEQRAVMLDKDDIGDIGDIVVTVSKEANVNANANATVNATVEKEETLMMMAGDTDNETHSESCNTSNSKNREKMESMTELKPFESNLKPFHDIDNHAIGGIEDDDDDNNNISHQLSDKSNNEMRSPMSNNESPSHFTGRRSNNANNDDTNATKRTRSNSKGSAGSKSTVSGKSRRGNSPESSIRESISAARQAIIQIGKTGSYTNISSVGSRGSTTGSMGSNASSKKVSVTWESTAAIAAATATAATTGGEDGALLASSDTPQTTTSPRGTALVKKARSERDMVREAMQRSFFSKSKSSRSVILRPSRKAATEEAEAVRNADGGGDAQLSTTTTTGDAGDGDNGREAMETLGEAKQNGATAVGTSDNAKGDDGSSTPRESIAQIGKRRSFASPESTASPSGQDEVEKEAQSTTTTTTTTTTTEARKETKEAERHGTSTIASDALRTFRNSILSKMETSREQPSPSLSSPPPSSRVADDSNDDDDADRRDPGAAIDVVQCGIPEINGRYHRFEIIDGVPSYSKIQSYEGKEAIFTIGRWNSDPNDDDNGNNDNDDNNNNGDGNGGGTSSSKKWHVTATIPHREKELAFYVAYAPSSARHPPSKNWMVVEGNEDFLEEGRYEGRGVPPVPVIVPQHVETTTEGGVVAGGDGSSGGIAGMQVANSKRKKKKKKGGPSLSREDSTVRARIRQRSLSTQKSVRARSLSSSGGIRHAALG